MSDIFREIEQEVRREEALKLWSRYWVPILAVAALIILATAGWRFWEYRRHRDAEAAGARFEAAIALAHEGKTAQALGDLDAIAKRGPSGYALLARLRAASAQATSNAAAAVKAYDAIGRDQSAPEPIRDAARLRAAFLLVDSANSKEIVRRLDPLAAPSDPYHPLARELLALIALEHKDYQGADHWLQMILTDPDATLSARARATALLSLVASAPRPAAQPTKPSSSSAAAPESVAPATPPPKAASVKSDAAPAKPSAAPAAPPPVSH